MKDDVDAFHDASSEIPEYYNELSSNYWRRYFMLIHLMQVKLDKKKPQMPQQIDPAVKSYRINLVKIEGVPTTYS